MIAEKSTERKWTGTLVVWLALSHCKNIVAEPFGFLGVMTVKLSYQFALKIEFFLQQ